jgi:hypothetical protein
LIVVFFRALFVLCAAAVLIMHYLITVAMICAATFFANRTVVLLTYVAGLAFLRL